MPISARTRFCTLRDAFCERVDLTDVAIMIRTSYDAFQNEQTPLRTMHDMATTMMTTHYWQTKQTRQLVAFVPSCADGEQSAAVRHLWHKHPDVRLNPMPELDLSRVLPLMANERPPPLMMHSAKHWSARVGRAAAVDAVLQRKLNVAPAARALKQAPHFYFFVRESAINVDALVSLLGKMGVKDAFVRADVGSVFRVECV